MINPSDIVLVPLKPEDFQTCITVSQKVSPHIQDRTDLHARDDMERFINVLMGEVAEQMVLAWLKSNGKQARSAVDKNSKSPDAGHDVIVLGLKNKELTCSVKSSLSYKMAPEGILKYFKLATKPSELRDINVQVYFWLTLDPPSGQSRVTVPAIRQSALIGWFTPKDLERFAAYNHENRLAPKTPLSEARPMKDLLQFLKPGSPIDSTCPYL